MPGPVDKEKRVLKARKISSALSGLALHLNLFLGLAPQAKGLAPLCGFCRYSSAQVEKLRALRVLRGENY